MSNILKGEVNILNNMQKLYSSVFYSDYGQFFLGDTDTELDQVGAHTFTTEDFAKRYKSNGLSICISTYIANWYWIEVFLADTLPIFNDAERILAFSKGARF